MNTESEYDHWRDQKEEETFFSTYIFFKILFFLFKVWKKTEYKIKMYENAVGKDINSISITV